MRRVSPHDDRGVIGLIPAIVMLVLGGAAAAATIAIYNATKPKPIVESVYLEVTDTNATRDASGVPHVQIKYKVSVAGERPASITPDARITCYVVTESRTISGQASLFVDAGSNKFSQLTVTPRSEDSAIEGSARVSCDVLRDGHGYKAKPVTVTIPGPNTGAPGGVDANTYVGKYDVTFTLTNGILDNCQAATRHRTFTVTARSKTAITIEVGGLGTEVLGISRFDSNLSATAQFSGAMFLNPGESIWSGFSNGAFATANGIQSVSGNYVRDDKHCTYSFTGLREVAAAAGSISISLDDIDGVDGCKPTMSTLTTTAGKATFKVINNTFGFAQVFIYDGERNLVANNDKTIPERGGSVMMTAQLVAGSYTVTCDGPGSADQSVTLTVN